MRQEEGRTRGHRTVMLRPRRRDGGERKGATHQKSMSLNFRDMHQLRHAPVTAPRYR